MKSPSIEKYAFDQGREAPHFSMEMSRVFGKKVGDFNKKGSESLDFTGLEIPRDYQNQRRYP